MNIMQINNRQIVWQLLSSFGIVYALLSFFDEMNICCRDPKYLKGILSCIFGIILYFIIPHKMNKRSTQKKFPVRYNGKVHSCTVY
jgi:hypothetical protein